MYILAIESSSDISSISIGKGNEIVCEYNFKHNLGLLKRLSCEIENMLSSSEIEIGNLGAIAVSLGPGSFTGLRIGITAAKALAYALDIPLIGVPTLDAIAENVSYMDNLICPMIFARENEVYFTVFEKEKRLLDYNFMNIEDILKLNELKDKKVHFLGTGARKNIEYIKSVLGKNAIFPKEFHDFPRGMSIISIANRKLNLGQISDPYHLVPMYIKKPTPVIRLHNKEKNNTN